ncbi:hypothetical protein KY362_03845 [Candidatus Woesearchaeota archaeon]|nr:hypothetical protein [Candidatus Woesearchaeota archaeon]
MTEDETGKSETDRPEKNIIQEVRPMEIFNLFDRDRLTDLDRTVFDSARAYAEQTDPSYVGIKSSANWTIRVFGAKMHSQYFVFSGYQGGIHFASLRKVGARDYLELARDEEYLELVSQAKRELASGFKDHRYAHVNIPLGWVDARHMNQGLYEEARQFEIEPPCLVMSGYAQPDEIRHVVEELVASNRRLDDLVGRRARGED